MLDVHPVTRHESRRAQRQKRRLSWFTVIAGCFGVLILFFPMAASWFSALQHNDEISGFVTANANVASADMEELHQAAVEYNSSLPGGPLRDPYALGPDGQMIEAETIGEDYYRQLAVGGTDVIARITVPSVGIDLPVYHGTDEDTLKRGAGHLFGTSLPVGGSDTHSVITAHSGLPRAEMFNELHGVELGDQFVVTVLGEQLVYEVDQITTVEPDQARELEVVAGEDHVTLITCTPIGVNSHRLLVRGERIDVAASDGTIGIAGESSGPGFPWWALAIGTGLAGSFGLAFVRRRPAHSPESQHNSGAPS